MLLDANGLIYRGYFALPPLTTKNGELVNAVFGFCQIVLRGFQDLAPAYVAASFDLPGPTFRHEQFAEYKATRQRMPDDLADQFPKVRAIVAALGIPVYELAGYEADDVIGTLTRQAEELGVDTTIVTGDLDMLQLVSERTRLMTTRSGVQNTVIYDEAKIDERYGLVAAQMVDFKSLKGDTTDNIPGIPGVGEKTAAKLLQDWRSLEGIYENVALIPDKLRVKLEEHREQVFRARELSIIHRDLPVELDLEAARHEEYDRDEVVRLFREYEFRTLIERLPPLGGEAARAPGELLREADAGQPIAAVQVDGGRRPEAWGASRAREAPPALAAERGDGLQLAIDFDTLAPKPSTGTRSTGSRSTATATAPSPRATAVAEALPADPTAALTAALAEPERLEILADEAAVASVAGWLAAQEELSVALTTDDARPRRGTLLGLGVTGSDGRTLTAEDGAAGSLLAAIVESHRPLYGHEVKRVLVAQIDARDRAAL